MTKQLFLLNARELFRDRRFFVFALVFPYGMLLMFLLIGKVAGTPEGGPDMVALAVPMAIFLAVTGSGLTVTAGPLAALRKQGTLRLLGTTPVRRSTFIGMHLLVRGIMLVVQLAGLLAIAWAFDAITAESIVPLFVGGVLCLVFFLAIGYLLGSTVRSPDAATGIGTVVQLGSLFASGLVLPFALLPDKVGEILGLLPTTFAADLLVNAVPALESQHTSATSAAVVVASAAVVLVLAVWRFRWNDDDA